VVALAGGGSKLPVSLVRGHGEVAIYVWVCINGGGPYPFVLDSGAESSAIAKPLADKLGLVAAGSVEHFAGVGCTVAAQPVAVQSWSVSGLALAAQSLAALPLLGMGGAGEPDGLLGADVLSRFGAMKIDFVTSTLSLAGPEGPVAGASGVAAVANPAAALPAAVAVKGPSTQIALTVVDGAGYVAALMAVDFPRDPGWLFAVDTGSSRSGLNRASINGGNFGVTGLVERATSVCARVRAPLVNSGAWSTPQSYIVRNFTLPAVALAELDLGGSGAQINGLLGADVLAHYSYVTIDFAGSRLVLGPRVG
jgi:hypothetical protein